MLHAEMRGCRRCLEAGYWIAPGPVFSSGPRPQVMLIGQAPGITEGQVKRPFNAGSGRRLFQWLGEAGWDEAAFRAGAYMTAVTKCYPGPNAGAKGDRVPGKAEQALCRPWLEQEIRLVNPRLMILVGGLAIKLLYPTSMRLDEIIGTAAYFPPEALADPLNFDLGQAEVVKTTDNPGLAAQRRTGAGDAASFDPGPDSVGRRATGLTSGRWVVPLPHPSGASLWPNAPENRALIRRAIALLDELRRMLPDPGDATRSQP
jgi:uracil-DNA glycosylase